MDTFMLMKLLQNISSNCQFDDIFDVKFGLELKKLHKLY